MESKLISMTDFIFYLDELNGGLGEQETGQIFEYAKFLKQPLKLEYFVPCDEKGNVFDKPKNYDIAEPIINSHLNHKSGKKKKDEKPFHDYKKAKQNVLFICNKIEHYEDCIVFNELFYYSKELKNFRPWLNRRFVKDGIIDTIEELIPCGLKITSETAKKLELP